MKGYVVILYVNAAIFGLVAFASLGYGLLLHRSANQCFESGGGELCQRERNLANASYRASPFLFALGAGLFGFGYFAQTKRPPAVPHEARVMEPPRTPPT